MEIEGKIIKVLDKRTGQSPSGSNWTKQDFVLEQPGLYERKMVFTVSDGLNSRIARLNLCEGKKYHIWFNIDAHEYQGRWFNTIQAYDAREIVEQPPQPQNEEDSDEPF